LNVLIVIRSAQARNRQRPKLNKELGDDYWLVQMDDATIAQMLQDFEVEAHRRFVLRQPCLVCERVPSDAHHLTFTQPRAMGRRVSDEFTVCEALA
jgi:hypothetical protein